MSHAVFNSLENKHYDKPCDVNTLTYFHFCCCSLHIDFFLTDPVYISASSYVFLYSIHCWDMGVIKT